MMCDMILAELKDRERRVRLAQITGCPKGVSVDSWLIELGLLVSFDGVNYVLTQRAIDLILLDEVENPYR
jgi:hypothetical protein